MEWDPRIAEALARLPDYLGQHVLLSISALTLGLLLTTPLTLLALKCAQLRAPLLAVASVVQTIPAIALLALFYPLLLGLSVLSESFFGARFSALGFWPALLALTLYSMLPMLRNAVIGLLGVDSAVKEAAQGVGMTPYQSLLKVELPLALPVIMGGVRTAAVWVIGIATLATPVGQTSLGNYIFTGLQTQNWIFVLFGCVAAAGLALVVDGILAAIEKALARRERWKTGAASAAFVLLVVASAAPVFMSSPHSYVIGGKGFTEQYILAALIEERLRDAELVTTTRSNLGSSVIFGALAAGDIDVYVDYSGTIWANAMRRSDFASRETIIAQTSAWLKEKYGVTLLGRLGFENAYALAMRRDAAKSLNIVTIGDLAREANTLSMAADLEFFARPEWGKLQDDYGLSFRAQREMQATFMYEAAASGEVDVISAYTSDGRIAQYDLVVLQDPKQSLPPYDAILLLAPGRETNADFVAALRPLLGAVDIAAMRQANLMVGRAEAPVSAAAAASWLNKEIQRSAASDLPQ